MTPSRSGRTFVGVSSVLALALGGCCDARLRGVVSDETTGAPIAGALVQSGAVEACTDELGFFDLQGLSCDDVWRVSVSAPGYNLLSTSVVPRPGEDPQRLVRDLALVPLARTERERGREAESPRPVEDYRPRHASAAPAERPDGEVARGVVAFPSAGKDGRFYIELGEDRTQALMRHLQTHGSERFTRALRALIDSLPQK